MTTLQSINNKYFNIAFWNVNSLLNKIDHLQQFIKDKGLSVLGISETKMDFDTHPSAYAIPGYCCVSKPRNRYGGGVAIYIRSDIPFTRISNLESRVLEHLCIDVVVQGKTFNVNVIYRPPKNDLLSQTTFLNNIDFTLNKISRHTCFTSIFWRGL